MSDNGPRQSPGPANTDLDLERDDEMEFEDDEFHDRESNPITQSNDHMEEDNEVRMRARRVTRSRGRSLEIEGYSYDDENDSRLIHNVSSNLIKNILKKLH
jgi:hypothetical protein